MSTHPRLRIQRIETAWRGQAPESFARFSASQGQDSDSFDKVSSLGYRTLSTLNEIGVWEWLREQRQRSKNVRSQF
jgi:hypothetical protein